MPILTKKFFIPSLIKEAILIILALLLYCFYGKLLIYFEVSIKPLILYYFIFYSAVLFYGLFLFLGLLKAVKKEKLAVILHHGTKVLMAIIITTLIGVLLFSVTEVGFSFSDIDYFGLYFGTIGIIWEIILTLVSLLPLIITGLFYWAYRINKRDMPNTSLKCKINSSRKAVIMVIGIVLLITIYIWMKTVKMNYNIWAGQQLDIQMAMVRDAYNLAFQKIILLDVFVFLSAYLVFKTRTKE